MRFLVPFLLCLLSGMASADTLTDGLTFYASFDESLAPENAAGATASSGHYHAAPGRVGKAQANIHNQNVTYPCAGNLNRKKGSLSIWVYPKVNLAEHGQNAIFFATTDPNSMRLVYDAGKNVVFYVTAGTPPGHDWKWNWDHHFDPSALSKDTWTHIVLTWNDHSGALEGPAANLSRDLKRKIQKKLYLNGKLHSTTAVEYIDGKDEREFFLGGNIPAFYDELMVWNRVLTDQEVCRLFEEPQVVAKTMHALPPLAKPLEWKVYPELVYREFGSSLVKPGEPFTFDATLVNRTDAPQKGQLVLTLLDLWEKPHGESVVIDFDLASKARQAYPAKFVTKKTGAFKVEAKVVIDGQSQLRDIASFGCVPGENPPKHPFFGMHIQQQNEEEVAMIRRLGFAANRVHDQNQFTWWRDMEYRRGEWIMYQKTSHYDPLVRLGFDIWGEWFAAPNWAVTLKNGEHPEAIPITSYPRGWMPTDMDAYRNYVRESIRRFPVIQKWEVWNEPWSSYFFEGSVEDYVTLCKNAYEVAKAENPNLTIYANIDDGVWGRAVLQAGLLKYVDGISYHQYTSASDDWDAARKYARKMRELVGKHANKPVPMTLSEGGMSQTTFLRGLDFPELPPPEKRKPLNFRQAAARMVQFSTTLLADGVEHWFYYFHTEIGPGNAYDFYATLEITRVPRPGIIAMGFLIRQLDGGTFVGEKELPGRLRAYVFRRNDGQSVAVLWTTDEAEVDVAYSGKAIDIMGNPIEHKDAVRVTSEPLYLRHAGPAEELTKLLEESKVSIVRPPVERKEITPEGVTPPKKMDDFALAAELGESRMIPLDIRAAANMSLTDEKAGDGEGGWTDEGPFNDLRDLKPGRHTWLGVPVQIIDPAANDGKAVVTLRGRTLPAGPEKSKPIPVGKKVRGLFFTQAANYAQAPGAQIGKYVIRYADGETVDVPLVAGTNIFDWWFDHQEGEDSRTITITASQSLSEGQPYRWLRMWYWQNPRMQVPVESITVEAAKGDPTFVLLGVTAAIWDK